MCSQGSGFETQQYLQQILVNFMTNLSYFIQNTTIPSILPSIVKATIVIQLGMDHDNL